MHILLIEDDVRQSNYIQKGLQEHSIIATTTTDGKDGLFLATTEKYDLIILDRMLPSVDGLTILQTLRASDTTTPVLLLSALADTQDKVQGLQAGADDYLTKPFSFIELLARIKALHRRSTGVNPLESTVNAKNISLDILTRKARCNNEIIDLMPREFKLLEYLMRNKNQIVSRTMLLEAVWEYHFDAQTNVIDVHISRLRKKISDNDSSIIQTVRGAGYIIED